MDAEWLTYRERKRTSRAIALASEESAKTAQAIDAFESLAQRLEAMRRLGQSSRSICPLR
jgi:hypothetical protein